MAEKVIKGTMPLNTSTSSPKHEIELPNAIAYDEKQIRPNAFRSLGFTLRRIIGDYRYIVRQLYREFRAIIRFLDLVFVVIGFLLLMLAIIIIFDLFIPELTGTQLFGDNSTRMAVGVLGAGGVVLRILMRPPVIKFMLKTQMSKELTYIFGSTKYAEELTKLLVFHYAYEEKTALISDKDYYWVRSLAVWMSTYVEENIEEFAKPNFYDLIRFKNAKRVFILSDNVEINQNVLTNIRRLRPDVPIYMLANYTPTFLKKGKILDPNLFIIDDIESMTKSLVLSLSLDIKWPQVTEISVPCTYYKSPAIAITAEVPSLEVLAVKRGDELLRPETILKRDDRLLIHYCWTFDMKCTNRVIQEFYTQPYPPKEVRLLQSQQKAKLKDENRLKKIAEKEEGKKEKERKKERKDAKKEEEENKLEKESNKTKLDEETKQKKLEEETKQKKMEGGNILDKELKKQEDEQKRKKQEEEARRKKLDEETKRKKQDDETKRKKNPAQNEGKKSNTQEND